MSGPGALLDGLGRGVERALLRPRDGPFLTVLCLTFFGLAAALSQWLFGGVPHVQDSAAQFIHAKFFARGALTGPSPELAEFFRTPLMIVRGGRWYSQFPPGHTALLAVGHLFGVAWLVNPALGAATIPALHALARETHGRTVGRVAALLLLLCPFVVFMSSEFMNHASTLLFLTLFLLSWIRGLRRGRLRDAAAAGAALGMAFLIRPFTAFAVALPFGLLGLVWLGRAPRPTARVLAAAGAVFLVFAGVQAAFNQATNGDPFLYGYQVRFGPNHRPGFVEHPPTFHPGRHTLERGLANARENAVELNRHLFGWPGSSLAFAALALLLPPRRGWSLAYASAAVSLGGAYVFYFYQDQCFGPRLVYEASAPCLILSAAGMVGAARWLGRRRPFAARGRACGALALAVAGLFGASALSYLPGRLAELGDDYWIVDGDLYARLEALPLENALVLINSEYRSVAFANPQSPDARVLYVRDLGAQNARLLERHPDRAVYRERDGELEMLRGPGRPLERIRRGAPAPP